ncbi:hypothetical protein DB32_004590 [Sandaracinus amylolyticus]|uniref:Uncharacterized protein n=1 Tax=Sandaracinus amylolyticus TaxID=927083 RepID=A0A0F6YKM0_9BACT|nr:hypothetical protein DB32_004590 [Sandaracinus amylolyticus]
MLAGRCARGNRGAADHALLDLHLDLERRVTARIEDLASDDAGDLEHDPVLLFSRKARVPRAARDVAARESAVND